jgi:DNA-binding FadR family transcriptional regulator
MSNNVLLPLMYYSFKEEAEYLWGLSYKHLGIDSLYQEKSMLLEGIRKRDTDSVERQVKETIDSSIKDLKLYSN